MSAQEQAFDWHRDAWAQLTALEGRLPHALLLRGRAGVGKTVFARAFAQWLLCEGKRTEYAACGECEACGWFAQGNHPDFRQVEPEILEIERNPELELASKEPSKQIRIEQVRALQNFLSVGTHRGRVRAIIVRPAEAMNHATANALLKSLEEPPAGTLFLLVSSHAARLLPTIRSRCRAVDLPAPTMDEGAKWLAKQGVSAPENLLAYTGSAPLAAIEAAESLETRNKLLNALAQGESDPLQLTDACGNASLPQVVEWLQKWLYDLSAMRLHGRARYFPQAAGAIGKLAGRFDPVALLALQRRLCQARAVANHPVNPRLFLEELFMGYRTLVA